MCRPAGIRLVMTDDVERTVNEDNRDRAPSFAFPRRFTGILFCLVAVLSIVLLALTWGAPILAESVLIRYMERAGIENPEVRVESISPRGIVMSGLKAQNGRISLDFLAIRFSPSGLMKGTVDRILASGLTWRITVRDDGADAAFPPSGKGLPSAAGPVALPFGFLEITSSAVVIDFGGWSLNVPFSGRLESRSRDGMMMTALCEPLGIPFTIHGRGNLETGEARFGIRVSNRTGKAVTVPPAGQSGPSLSGLLDIRADWHREAGSSGLGTVSATALVKGLTLDTSALRVRLDEGFIAAGSDIDENLALTNLEGGVSLEGLRFMEWELPFLTLTQDGGGTRTHLSARLEKPLRAVITAESNHSPPASLLNKKAPMGGHVDWVLEGTIPEELVLFHSNGMVSTDGDISFHARGDIHSKPAPWPRVEVDITTTAVSKNPLRLRMGDKSIHFGQASLEGRATLGGDGLEGFSALIGLEGGTLDIPSIPVRIGGISLRVPLAMGEEPPQPGHFTLGQVSFAGIDRPGPAGQIALYDGKLRLDGSWLLLSPSPLIFSTDLAVEGGTLAGSFTGSMDWCDLPDQKDLSHLVPGLGDVDITGQVRGEFLLDLPDPHVKPRLKLSLRNLNIRSRSKDLTVEGLAGTVTFTSLDPLNTPGNQVCTVDRLRLGAFDLEQGSLAFRVENRDRLFLERSAWNIPQGGSIALRAARVDLESKRLNLEVLLEDIDIIALLSRLTEGKVAGSGLIYGRLPLTYERGRLTFERGYVYSVPGTGRVGIHDEQWLRTIMFHINEAMAGHPHLSLVARRMEEALKDFEYTYLTMDLKKKGQETAARIEVRGKGMTGDPPQEIGSLVLNVNDLDEIINRVLGFTLSSRESVDRTLEELLDFR